MLVVLLLVARSFLAGLGSRRELMLENLALRHQLQVALRTNPHPRLRPRDRVLWVWLHSLWPDGWRQHLRLVRPGTVLRWHRKGWRLYWTWKSRARLGRPHLSTEVKELIARISKENPLWGSERIRGDLLKLGVVVSNRSIRRYRWRRVGPGHHQHWHNFLTNQLHGIWAADLFVVQTVGYRILYVFLLLRHDRREWIHFNVTASPTAAWLWRQVVEATPLGRQPKFFLHDRDADYGGDFDERLGNLGIKGVRTPARAPKANAIGERIVRTIRSECLDHLIVINERHLQAVLGEFADYYNRDRPHRSLALQSPVHGCAIYRTSSLPLRPRWSTPCLWPGGLNRLAFCRPSTLRRESLDHLIVLNEQQLRSILREFVPYYNRDRPHRSLALKTPEVRDRRQAGKLVCRPVLGGLHHSYEWAA